MDMELGYPDDPDSPGQPPPPPGVDYDDDQRRSEKHESRSRSKEYDRHERTRPSRFDRDDSKSTPYSEDIDYRNLKDDSGDGSYSRSRDGDSSYGRSRVDDSNYSRGRDGDSSYGRGRDGDSSYSRSKDRDRESRYERSRYRDRSRDRSRDRDRGRDRDRDRSWDRDRDRKERMRERDRDRNELKCRDDIPNTSIIIKGLPSHVVEDDIRCEIVKYSLHPLEVVLKKDKGTGESRGFAFVEFRLLSDAVRWKELTQSVLYFGQVKATLHYCMPREASDRIPIRMDWTCLKCGLNNFRKRDYCFKCNCPREQGDINSLTGEGCEEVSTAPSCTLLFRNLDTLTTEERVLNMLGQITALPIKKLKVAKDLLTNTSRGFAYVELHTVSEAMQLHDLLVSMTGNFYVDGRQVTVSYCRRSLSSLNSVASANAASAALAAAQWTNQGASQSMFSDSTIRNKQMESVQSLNAGSSNGYLKGSTPDTSSYQYDPTSGYYYDASTGYYYDANSQYYYNSKTQQYLYWDLEKQSYVVVPTTDSGVSTSAVVSAPAVKAEPTTGAVISNNAVISSAAVISGAPMINKKDSDKPKEKINAQDKVKFAKKVAKDMEKWAKTLNQKKENNKMIHNFTPKSAAVEQPISKPLDLIKTDTQTIETHKGVEMEPTGRLLFAAEYNQLSKSASATIVAEYSDASDPELEPEVPDEGTVAMELLKLEEARLIDWTKLMCLLCKRQFPTKDVLSKHIQKSDLHKQNVGMLKLTKLTPRQLQELEKRESGYRDRAKERREKFGQPDLPPPNKLKTKYMKERKEAFQVPERPIEAIGSDNIGNKMLKAMGWSEGQGLGKTGQGMSGIIEVQRRVKSAGLGMKGSQYGATASDSYKDAVRKSMQARYNEIS